MVVLTDIDWNKVEMHPMSGVGAECTAEITYRGMSGRAKGILALKLTLICFRLFCLIMGVIAIILFINISNDITSGEMEPVWDLAGVNGVLVLLVGLVVAYMLFHKAMRI